MNYLFFGCSSLKSLPDISNWDTSNVVDMQWMFGRCSSLKELDLSNFHTEKVEYMSGMFKGDVLLEDLNISSFVVDNVYSMNEMFTNCPLPRGVDWIVPVGLNLPMYHPHYRQKHAVDVYALKKAVYAFCCGVDEEERPKFDEDAIIPDYLPIWQAFKKNGFNFYKFMKDKDYEQIEDEGLCVEFLMGACFPILKLPIAKFMTDWLNGYLDFFIRYSSVEWLDVWGAKNGIITDIRQDGHGCSICCSSASVMSETLKGKTLEEAQQIIEAFYQMIQANPISEEMEEKLGEAIAYTGVSQFPACIKCATLSWKACEKAINEEDVK